MVRLELTEQQLQALAGLLDAGVKAIGLRAVKDAAVILKKLEMATQELSNGEDHSHD